MTCPYCGSPDEPVLFVHANYGYEEVEYYLTELLNNLDNRGNRGILQAIVRLIHETVGIEDDLDPAVQFFEVPYLGIRLRADERGMLLAPMDNVDDDSEDDDGDLDGDENVEVDSSSDDSDGEQNPYNQVIEISDDDEA